MKVNKSILVPIVLFMLPSAAAFANPSYGVSASINPANIRVVNVNAYCRLKDNPLKVGLGLGVGYTSYQVSFSTSYLFLNSPLGGPTLFTGPGALLKFHIGENNYYSLSLSLTMDNNLIIPVKKDSPFRFNIGVSPLIGVKTYFGGYDTSNGRFGLDYGFTLNAGFEIL